MAIAYFPSLSTHDLVEVELLDESDQFTPMKLLVDSGFTGTSSLAISATAIAVRQAPAPAVQVVGALSGTHSRVLVTARVSQLGFERSFIAILANLESLQLPDDVCGVVGLRFLRCFERWGAEVTAAGSWRFFLEESR